jgi:DDE family transposase
MKCNTLQCSDAALAMVYLLNFTDKFDLCLDRTNWKFGKKNINYLVLSWRVNKKISLPLMAVELDKAGNSNTQERIDILDQFNELFGFERVGSLIADREFIGEIWYKKLIQCKVPFFIRIKENGLLPYGDGAIHVKDLFNHLQAGQYRVVEKSMYESTVYFAGTRFRKGDLVIVITNQNWHPQKILEQYRKCWSIEELFKKFKTSGFHWENTHMKISSRLISLLVVLSLAALLLYCMGMISITPWKKTLGCPLWSLFKQGMVNFQHQAAKGTKVALKFMLKALDQAIKLEKIKSDG